MTVLRSGGFNKVVDVAVQGLPEGLTAEVVKWRPVAILRRRQS